MATTSAPEKTEKTDARTEPLVAPVPRMTSFIKRASNRRSWSDKIADWCTESAGSFTFLILNVIAFATWIAANDGLIPQIPAFDPYPFNFLTMTVSLEAIILSVLVLISQNRAAKTADLREEVGFQINATAEREVTLALQMLVLILRKHRVKIDHHSDVQESLKPLDLGKIEKQIEKQLDEPAI